MVDILRVSRNECQRDMRNALCMMASMTEVADRLREARSKAGYSTGSDAARAFGWPISTYLGHENGDRKIKIDTAQKYCSAFGVDLLWLLNGTESSERSWHLPPPRHVDVPLVGLAGTGGFVDPRLTEKYGNFSIFIRLPLFTSHNLVAVEIIGNYSPKYDEGDIIVIRTGYEDPEPFVNKFCLVETSDGLWYFRKLIADGEKSTYKLEAINAPTVHDIEINQIGAIYMTLPAAQVGPPKGFLERVRTFGDPREPEMEIDTRLRKKR